MVSGNIIIIYNIVFSNQIKIRKNIYLLQLNCTNNTNILLKVCIVIEIFIKQYQFYKQKNNLLMYYLII